MALFVVVGSFGLFLGSAAASAARTEVDLGVFCGQAPGRCLAAWGHHAAELVPPVLLGQARSWRLAGSELGRAKWEWT